MRKAEAIQAVAELQAHVTELAPAVKRLGLPMDIDSIIEELKQLEALARSSYTARMSQVVVVRVTELSRRLSAAVPEAQVRLN
ncbi:hypothetical protein [Mycolicibacterium aubagnense]|nr:hypothetical protein [Mycolicibacterium aubagnense]TLH48570.1 hypothetical protein C1S80_29770 [Mycolicibacterium aubagnense]